jgi:conjugative transposon TraK protein
MFLTPNNNQQMNLIKNIEAKMKLAFAVATCALVAAVIISIASFSIAASMVAKERKQIYILDKNVSVVATKSDVLDNREAEYRSDIAAFHEYFFSMTPDNQQIERQMNKAMYLVDATGVAQYNSLKERGYFTNIITSSTIINCITDSILLDMNTLRWKYFGKEKIERPSMRTIRTLVTEGGLMDIPRTVNNPHGCLITNWKTLENSDISNEAKKLY